MKPDITLGKWVLGSLLALWLISPQGVEVVRAQEHAVVGPHAGTWSAGTSIGFLGNTVDDTAFAWNLFADYFVDRHFSFGPLLQMAFTGNLTQVGLSGQGKYWIDLDGMSSKTRLNLQAGLGFVHADRGPSDTSFLIPIGIGLDHRVTERMSLTADFLLNFTDLNVGAGRTTTVMPGLTFGVRF